MDRIVEVLLEQESMTGDEFRALLSQYAQASGAAKQSSHFQIRLGCAPGCAPELSRLCSQWPAAARAGRWARRARMQWFARCAVERAVRPYHHASSLPPAPSPLNAMQIPQENLDAVARQKQPDAELQLA